MAHTVRNFFRYAGAAGLLTLASVGTAGAVATDKCADAPFGSGSLTCTVEKNDVFPGTGSDSVTAKGNDHETEVEAALNHIFGTPVDIVPVETDIDRLRAGDFEIDPEGRRSEDFTTFDWTYTGSATLAYLTVKARTGFAIFDIAGLTSGTASINGLLTNKHGKTQDISHIGFWSANATGGLGGSDDPPPAVSEPAVLGMASAGIAGLLVLGRIRRQS